MVDFKLDTSGEVELTAGGALSAHYTWTDLSPFAQGYVEALFASILKRDRGAANEGFVERPLAAGGLTSYRAFGRFSDVAIGARDREDALREASRSRNGVTLADIDVWSGDRYTPVIGFSDLSPEALALILKDCEAYTISAKQACIDAGIAFDGKYEGRMFWIERQFGERPAFPPLTISLGDDGKIHLSPSHEHGAAK